MATLDSFGFAKGKRNKTILNQNQQICAFVSPSTVIKKAQIDVKPTTTTTPLTKQQKKKRAQNLIKSNHTITKFFTPKTDVEMTEAEHDQKEKDEEVPIICTIRKKLPIIKHFWNLIQSEYTLDELVEEEPLEEEPMEISTSVKRKREDNNQQVIKLTKKKKTVDLELSNFMKNFLNIQEKRRFNNNMMLELRQNIKTMEQDDKEDDEDLTRQIKHKLTTSQSNLLMLKITNELFSL